MRQRLAQVLGSVDDGLERMDTVVRRFWWSAGQGTRPMNSNVAAGQVIDMARARAARNAVGHS